MAELQLDTIPSGSSSSCLWFYLAVALKMRLFVRLAESPAALSLHYLCVDGRNHLLAPPEEKWAPGRWGSPVGWAGWWHRHHPGLAALGLANVSWVWFNLKKSTLQCNVCSNLRTPFSDFNCVTVFWYFQYPVVG